MVAINKMSKAALTLWGFSGSSTTNRIRIALATKKIPYTFQQVDLSAGQQKTKEWSEQKNMLEQIPVLQIGNASDDMSQSPPPVLLRQSLAILEYIEEAYPECTPPLLPKDPILRAQVREVAEIVNSFIQPMQNKLTVEKIAEMDPEFAEWLPKAVKAHLDGSKHGMEGEELNYWPHWWIRRGFNAVENLLDDDGPFCFGDAVTLADCALVPQVIGAKKYCIDLSPYPKIVRVYNSVTAISEIKDQMGDVLNTL